ncbi:T9SS type A sorting domain-containing protein [Zobellia uliginosa]|uniref:T9SS type A sorting domain-containing protein n=1 Tax=Zobellia uliginosa TaxID=143224 RepID=UPI0026E2850A|nr:T9SS type A sorting domain-containing protein [Zobellia uliginosa]MDO6516706.1 T9SS type A sorting domain-containing protein [Zobellia uliginosa]
MKIKLSIVSLCFVLVLFTVTKTKAQTADVYHFNFDELPTGPYDKNQMKDALGVSFCKGADEGRVSIESFPDQGKTLKIKYPKGQVKTGESGIHTKVYFNDGQFHDELYMSYKVYFPSDFEFRAGGKLPGLSYQTEDRNMSLRLMWRKNGLVETYVHYNTKPTRPGYKASINWSLTDPIEEPNGGPQADQVKFTKGAWQHIEMYYKLNTPGKQDGIMRGWLNGQLALEITNVEDFRQVGEGDIGLNSFYLSSFFGGSDESFQPTKDVYAYFDDFKVSSQRIGTPSGTANNQQVGTSANEAQLSPQNLSDSTGTEVKVYPNPVLDGILYLEGIDAGTKNISIYSMMGYRVKSWVPDTSTKTPSIDLGQLDTGTYIMVIESNKRKITKMIYKV